MTQLPLFRHHWHQRLHDRIIARLLWAANTRPPFGHRDEFYAMKSSLLARYATISGLDIQHIRKKCWSCNGTGRYSTKDRCRKCWGSGIYREFYVYLSRWEFAGHVFHRPIRLRDKINNAETVTIEGYVQHADLPGHLCPTCSARLWHHPIDEEARQAFRDLWDAVYGPGAWASNPWVFAYTFERVEVDHA